MLNIFINLNTYIIKTSFPLTLVLILTEISPSLNFLIDKSERFILKRLQISLILYINLLPITN